MQKKSFDTNQQSATEEIQNAKGHRWTDGYMEEKKKYKG